MAEEPPPFSLTRERLRLLPFDTRLSRLSAVTGVASTDPLFEAFRAKRVDLGDANYALGVTPDASWNAPKMLLWAKLLRPLCNATAVKNKFPQLATDPTALMGAAYGRAIEVSERQDVVDEVAKVPPVNAAEMACVVVLSSAEFLVQ